MKHIVIALFFIASSASAQDFNFGLWDKSSLWYVDKDSRELRLYHVNPVDGALAISVWRPMGPLSHRLERVYIKNDEDECFWGYPTVRDGYRISYVKKDCDRFDRLVKQYRAAATAYIAKRTPRPLEEQ